VTELIEHMKLFGWYEKDGLVKHDELGITYATWGAAIKGCIEVACEGI